LTVTFLTILGGDPGCKPGVPLQSKPVMLVPVGVNDTWAVYVPIEVGCVSGFSQAQTPVAAPDEPPVRADSASVCPITMSAAVGKTSVGADAPDTVIVIGCLTTKN